MEREGERIRISGWEDRGDSIAAKYAREHTRNATMGEEGRAGLGGAGLGEG